MNAADFEAALAEMAKGQNKPKHVVTSRRWLIAMGIPADLIPAGAGPFMLTADGITLMELEESDD